jgi:hypothetical protein
MKNIKKKKNQLSKMKIFHVLKLCTTLVFLKSSAETFDVSVNAWQR